MLLVVRDLLRVVCCIWFCGFVVPVASVVSVSLMCCSFMVVVCCCFVVCVDVL